MQVGIDWAVLDFASSRPKSEVKDVLHKIIREGGEGGGGGEGKEPVSAAIIIMAKIL